MRYFIHIENAESGNPGEYFPVPKLTESTLDNPQKTRQIFARALFNTDWPLAPGDIIKLVEDEDD